MSLKGLRGAFSAELRLVTDKLAVWPLGIAALEDKIVQRAVGEVLNAIYETDFLGFSYGFRAGRSQHNALDALATEAKRLKALEDENSRLKRMLAEAMLDNAALKDLVGKKW